LAAGYSLAGAPRYEDGRRDLRIRCWEQDLVGQLDPE
jgi:hypothetical protein